MSINYYALCCCAPRITQKPKIKQQKKNGKKKRKKKAIFSSVCVLVCKVFGKKILPLLSIKKQTTEKKSVEIFFTKYILTLQTKTKHTYLCFLFYFFGYV
jgi:hypothetical protein